SRGRRAGCGGDGVGGSGGCRVGPYAATHHPPPLTRLHPEPPGSPDLVRAVPRPLSARPLSARPLSARALSACALSACALSACALFRARRRVSPSRPCRCPAYPTQNPPTSSHRQTRTSTPSPRPCPPPRPSSFPRFI